MGVAKGQICAREFQHTLLGRHGFANAAQAGSHHFDDRLMEDLLQVDVARGEKFLRELDAGRGLPGVDKDMLKTFLEQVVVTLTEREEARH